MNGPRFKFTPRQPRFLQSQYFSRNVAVSEEYSITIINCFGIFTCGEVLTAGINTALAFKLVLITRPEELTFATNGDFDKTAKRCPVDVTTKIKLEI